MRIRVVGAAWIRGDRVLAAQRPHGKAHGGCWELPGGKVEPGESDPDALMRELREELRVDVRVCEEIGAAVHVDPRSGLESDAVVEIELVAYRVECADEPAPTEHQALRWLAAHELDQVGWAPADEPLIPPLRAVLSRR